MKGEIRRRWRKLCDQAATEDDPEKLVELYKEIICMLDEKAARLFKQWKEEQVELKPRSARPLKIGQSRENRIN